MSDLNCWARKRISACIVVQRDTNMSFRVVSNTGWFCVGNLIMESCSSFVSSREVEVSSATCVGQSCCSFGLDLAELDVTEEELDIWPAMVACNWGS